MIDDYASAARTWGEGMLIGADPSAFGYFIAALIATTGIAFASGVQFVVIGLWRRREAVYLSYAALCLCIAVLALGNMRLARADGLAAATAALHWMIAAAIASLAPMVVFIRAYTGAGTRWRLLLAMSLLMVVLLCVNGSAPATLFFSRLEPGQAIVLPWGERLYRVSGAASAWGLAFHVASYAVFLWALGRAWAQYRGGDTLRAVLLGGCLIVQFVVLLWGDIMVDLLGYQAPYLDAFAFLPFVLLMSLSLAAQMRRRTAQLEHTRRQLEVEEHTRHAAEQNLRHLAYHDSLTGLPNRACALKRLAESRADALARGVCGALLLIDLDNFKTINDGLGHHVGDRLLQAMAERLLAAAPPEATLARLGGDEFVLMLGLRERTPSEVQARAERVAQDVIALVSEPVMEGRHVLGVGASVGVAVYPVGEVGVADLLRRADIALYRAKAAGRNTVRVFLPPMQQEADQRLRLERGLREALEQDRMGTQFALHFQPQITTAGELLGAEALLRWHHPQLGEVAPEKFIPLAEETGLIHALGAWVVDEACAHLRAWDRDGIPHGGSLAVNVSAWQLVHPHYAARLVAQVHAAGVAPARLTLELTESALLQDFDGAQATLRRLAAAGFRLALDDFGVGYSSLNYLQHLPLDVLKIDRAFVSELQVEAGNPLAGFIIDMAHRLGIVAVAEGVETAFQRQALEQMGCDALQGYLISRPVDDASFRRWVVAHRHAPVS
ncbi:MULTISPECIES: EAL domain-containing protein [Rhodanobacter]|uniref:Diguanylate cyclase (GGDEF) domain-containing protein n=1 Tax=Rhodanobacter denitrificans TaxID=666685 RepID=M4NLU6_9GAMM|nr:MULTISPECIES: EAL domain-containing protein [Rhodanobacter]AGG90638.1 diguanylate cyclase (GGDEF) domain-containing protein [Rhodanobacter denitrificans]UJM86020.1 EAL domain-containing protein [Rhodanobacter denitrificans]